MTAGPARDTATKVTYKGGLLKVLIVQDFDYTQGN